MRSVSFFYLLVFIFASTAFAQTEGKHQVKIGIPQVLQLSLGADASSQAKVPIRIDVQDGQAVLTPDTTRLEIMANSDWQLSASYLPNTEKDAGAKLSWQIGSQADTFKSYPSIIQTGTKTSGWSALDIDYGLESLPQDGVYEGVVTYTLARP